MSHAHDGKPCDGLIWNPPPRCTLTGHRPVLDGCAPPVPTRRLPRRFWIFELIWRIEARLRRRYARDTP